MKTFMHTALLWLTVLLLTGCTPKDDIICMPEGNIELTFITIGKGDAFLLTAPQGEQYLIDTGKKSDFFQIARLLRTKGVDTLDGIFLSHGHLDHTGSLEPLLDAFTVKTIYQSAFDTVSYQEIDVGALAEAHHIPVEKLTGGDVIKIDGMTIRCWVPESEVLDNENNNSVVLRITYGETAFLFMGDAETDEEEVLLRSKENLRADLIKLGHHGEDDATSLALLEAVQPKYGLITGNQEENPDSINPTVANRLSSVGAQAIYSECEGLGIVFRSDGTKLTMETSIDPASPASSSVVLSDIDRKNRKITIKNTGADCADLSGYILFSKRGNSFFHFPADTVLKSGASITVSSRASSEEYDFLWDADAIWKKKDPEICLYDCNFILLDKYMD